MNFFEKLLYAKETRYLKQKYLLDKFKCSLVSFTMSIPGSVKSGGVISEIHKDVYEQILEIYGKHIVHSERFEKETGDEAYILIRAEASDLKREMIKIESGSFFGRLLDIDVFDRNGIQICRSDLNEPERKCIVCEETAKICIINKSHCIEELQKKTDEILREYKSKKTHE